MADELNKVVVKAAKSDNRVVLWERDAAHPNGEALVYSNGQSYSVAETKRVKQLMTEGVLVKGDASTAKERGSEPKAEVTVKVDEQKKNEEPKK